jgi:hypothetical protein
MRRVKVGKVVGTFERVRGQKNISLHLIERGTIERLSGAHAEGAIARSLVVLVGEVVGLDIVGVCGNGGIVNHGHIE